MAICPIFILMEICPINWAHMHSKSLIFLSIQYLASVNDITNSPKTTCLSESGKVKVTQSCPTLCNPKDYTVHGILQARILELGSLSLLQGIFPTQGLNLGLLHCRRILYQLSHKESPRILEWVGYPFSRGSSQPRNWTGVFCIAGGFFTNWSMREALFTLLMS